MTNTDEVFDALANEQRRRVLVHMLSHNPEDDSKPYIGNIEFEKADVEFFRIDMKHTHLPKLEEYGFIEWDREEQVVTKGPKFEEIRPILELLENHRDELPEGWL
jgi:hypothetical protein